MATKKIKASKPRATKLATAVNVSKNSKIGITAATYASRASCPKDCALWDVCYAKFGHVGFTTDRLDRAVADAGADALDVAVAEAKAISELTSGLPLRLHVVGDCATNRAAKVVSKAAVDYSARFKAPVWTYTHAHRKVKRDSWGAVSVLASCETAKDAKLAMSRGYAAALVTGPHPEDGKAYHDAATGIKIIPCPAQTRDAVQCHQCRLCWDDKRLHGMNAVVGFEAHGVKKSALLNILQA